MSINDFASPHSVLPYVIHVIAGVAILYSAIIALTSKKGSKKHITHGQTFVILSVLAGITALIFMNDFGFVPNIFGTSILAISVVISSFLALRPVSKLIKAVEVFCLFLTLTATVVLLNRFYDFASSDGLLSAASLFTFGCAFFPLFFLLYDLYFISRKSDCRNRIRLKRHVSGMAFMVAVMVHAPIVSVFTDVSVNFYFKFFAPYALWPLIYFYYVQSIKPNKSSKKDVLTHAAS